MNIAAIVIAILLEFVFPILLGFYLIRRFHSSWKLWLLSGLAFLLSDTLLNFVLSAVFSIDFIATTILPVTIFRVIFQYLIIGFVYQILRWVIFRFLRGDTEEKSGGLVSGSGFGGLQAIMVYGMNTLLFFISAMSFMSNGGQGLELTPEALANAEFQISQHFGRPFYLPLLEALPTLSELATQIALGLVTWVAVRRGGWLWHGAAVVWATMTGSLSFVIMLWYHSYPPVSSVVTNPEAGLALLSFLLLGGVNLAVAWFIWNRIAPLVEEGGPAPKSKPAIPADNAPAIEVIDQPKTNKLSSKPGKPVKLSKD